MIFYFIYEILIKKYNIKVIKDIFENSNKEFTSLNEIIIKYPEIIKTNNLKLSMIPEDDEFEQFDNLDMIV